MTSKELINIIVRNGWNMVRQKGSHVHFKKLQSGNLVTIPHPVLDIPIGTMKSILKKANIRPILRTGLVFYFSEITKVMISRGGFNETQVKRRV